MPGSTFMNCACASGLVVEDACVYPIFEAITCRFYRELYGVIRDSRVAYFNSYFAYANYVV